MPTSHASSKLWLIAGLVTGLCLTTWIFLASAPLPTSALLDTATSINNASTTTLKTSLVGRSATLAPNKGAAQLFEKLPLTFIENRGQMDARVGYYVQGRDKTVYFTPQGLTFAMTQSEPPPGAAAAPDLPTLLPVAFWPSAFGPTAIGLNGSHSSSGPREEPRTSQSQRWVVKLDFVGAYKPLPDYLGCVPSGLGNRSVFQKSRRRKSLKL